MQLDNGLRKLMSSTTDSWKADPTLLTYGGGSRSRRNGIFAGVTDIQGMDMYVDPNKAYDPLDPTCKICSDLIA